MTTDVATASEFYDRLLPGAQDAFVEFIFSRTPANLQDQMVTLVGESLANPRPANFGAWLQAQFNAAKFANWVWGDVQIDAPVVVTMSQSRLGWGVNLQGAKISPSASYPVNTAVDMITFIVPDGAPANTNITGFTLMNGVFQGLNALGTKVANNVVKVSCKLNPSFIYGGNISFNSFNGGTGDGLQLYGSVFEMTLEGNFASNNGFGGINMRNAGGANAGVISSIKFFGGDYRQNRYGIVASADVAFQEPSGYHIYGGDFIANTSAGIKAGAGVQLVSGCHFENNCTSNGGETTASIWIPFGFFRIDNCDNAYNFAAGVYLFEVFGVNQQQSVVTGNSYSLNENTGLRHHTGKMTGTDSMWIDNNDSAANYDGPGTWTVWKASATSTTV